MDGQDNGNNPDEEIRNNSRRGTHNSKGFTDPKVSEPNNNDQEAIAEMIEDGNVKGEKTIVCWNCQTVLMVKEEWNVVQCTNCDKINRVPGSQNDVNNQLRINDNLNHFDLYLPYVVSFLFYIINNHYELSLL